MRSLDDAILSIRAAVQDRGDERTTIGRPAQLDQIEWLGSLLGFQWPRTYLDLLARHDGVTVQYACIPAFYTAFKTFIVYRSEWHPQQFWPIGDNRCGDFWLLSLANQQNGDCPILFFEHETNEISPYAPSLPDFIVNYMNSIWIDRPGST